MTNAKPPSAADPRAEDVGLLREAIALAVCNSCEGELSEANWIVVDYTEHYNLLAAPDQRPGWMRDKGIWETERHALLCAWCAAIDNVGSAPYLSEYRNHRGPGLRLLGPDLRWPDHD